MPSVVTLALTLLGIYLLMWAAVIWMAVREMRRDSRPEA